MEDKFNDKTIVKDSGNHIEFLEKQLNAAELKYQNLLQDFSKQSQTIFEYKEVITHKNKRISAILKNNNVYKQGILDIEIQNDNLENKIVNLKSELFITKLQINKIPKFIQKLFKIQL